MKTWDTVTIVGVGLIGGSIGLALRDRGLARTIVGVGRTRERLELARQRGAIDRWTHDLAGGVAESDLIVVCTPVAQVVQDVHQIGLSCPPDALITDAGSTKEAICQALNTEPPANGHFVGSHPMAGSEKSGPEFAEEDLFCGRLTVVTPTALTVEEHAQQIERFWRSLDSQVVRVPPEEHDQAVADVSHLPHLIAAVLSAATPVDHLPFASTGWRDTTRVASGGVELWRQILTDNRGHVLRALDNFGKVLQACRAALDEDDQTELVRLLTAGKQNRDSVGS